MYLHKALSLSLYGHWASVPTTLQKDPQNCQARGPQAKPGLRAVGSLLLSALP